MNQNQPTSESTTTVLDPTDETLMKPDWQGDTLMGSHDLQTEPFPLSQPAKMKCEVCGNEYDKAFTVTRGSETHTFDSFECAIHAMAPVCAHCDCKVVGHGVEHEGLVFCCANCARHAGVSDLKDRS